MKNSGSANTTLSGESTVASVFNEACTRSRRNSQTALEAMAANAALATSESKSTLRGASPSTLLIKNSFR